MLVSQNAMSEVECTLQVSTCLRVETQVEVCIADGLADRSLNQRLAVELARDSRSSPVQSGAHLEVWVGLCAGSSLYTSAGLRQEIVLQKVVDCPSCGCFAIGTAPLARGGDEPSNQGKHHQRYSDRDGFVPLYKLAGAITPWCAARLDRAAIQVTADVVGEFLNRRVAARWLFFERFEHDSVGVARQCAAQA